MRPAGAGGGSTRDYVRGTVRLEVLRASVPCLKAAVEAALSRHFQQLQEYTLRANERALESVPRRLGAELLCWGRRCDVEVAVPPQWLVASGARFVAGNAHRREVLTHALGPLWAAQAELAALERELEQQEQTSAAPAEKTRATPLWVVDFRRMRGPTAAMCGAIPVCSLDGAELEEIPEAHAAAMRERSPRLADALRMGFANHEYWKARVEQPEAVEAASGVDAAVYREQVAAFVQAPGAVACKSCVYLLDTWVPDGACPHRPGALASQVYVGIVGSKEGDQVRSGAADSCARARHNPARPCRAAGQHGGQAHDAAPGRRRAAGRPGNAEPGAAAVRVRGAGPPRPAARHAAAAAGLRHARLARQALRGPPGRRLHGAPCCNL